MIFKNSIKTLLLVLSCLLLHFKSYSQTSVPTETKKAAEVQIYNDPGMTGNAIYKVTDNTVTFSRDFLRYGNTMSRNDVSLKTSGYYNTSEATRVRKGSVLIGALAGAATGAIVGLLTYKKSNDPQNFGQGTFAVMGGVAGALVGTLVGVLIHKRKD